MMYNTNLRLYIVFSRLPSMACDTKNVWTVSFEVGFECCPVMKLPNLYNQITIVLKVRHRSAIFRALA